MARFLAQETQRPVMLSWRQHRGAGCRLRSEGQSWAKLSLRHLRHVGADIHLNLRGVRVLGTGPWSCRARQAGRGQGW